MSRFYTPQVRFANTGSALTLAAIQTVEPTRQLTSDHADQPDHFSGVIRYRRDFRRFLVRTSYTGSATGSITYFGFASVSGSGAGIGGFGSTSGTGGGVFHPFPGLM